MSDWFVQQFAFTTKYSKNRKTEKTDLLTFWTTKFGITRFENKEISAIGGRTTGKDFRIAFQFGLQRELIEF